MPDTTWSTASHDVVTSIDFSLQLGEIPTYLHALLRSEHEEFRDPYDAVRANIEHVIAENEHRKAQPAQAPRADVSPQRLRTWKKIFEEFGLLYVGEGDQRVRTTALGRMIKELQEDLADKVRGANDHITRLGLAVLSRDVLRNPITSADYAADTNLHPYRAIWTVCRQLDNMLHWQEMNRVLMHLLRDEDVPNAIEHIRTTRATYQSDYSSDEAVEALGAPAVDDGTQTRRRITPWLAKAGFGGTFLAESEAGYWMLDELYVPLIDDVLAEPAVTPPLDLNSRAEYLDYLISGLEIVPDFENEGDRRDVENAVRIVRRLGSKKIIALSGIPGTGKTRLARLIAAELSDNDPYRFAEIQFHENTAYDNFVEGFVPRSDGSGYSLEPMTLRTINDRALRDPANRTYVLLIEELTRANVHAVLGELLTYVEHRDRRFRLTLSQAEIKIAPNLVILATMNPRDRSALSLDHAILRRIHQIDVPPSLEALRTFAAENLNENERQSLVAWYERYFNLLPFGHGEFAEARNAQDLRDLWRGTLRFFLSDADGEVRPEYREPAEQFPWR